MNRQLRHQQTVSTKNTVETVTCAQFLGDRLQNGSPYAIGPLSVGLSCLVCSVLSMTLVYCGQTVGRIQMKLDMLVGLGPSHTVLHGVLPQRGTAPAQFLAHVCSGHTAGWIKMPLGREVGLGLGHIVLDGDPAPLPQRGTAPQFSAHVYCGQTIAHLSYF